ncbi:MAG: C39 family peptidase [Cyanobacteriota bacterium]|nr:C39 family peptidase [Cyanobacteriota bacterium]
MVAEISPRPTTQFALTVTKNTVFKLAPVPSPELADNEKASVEKGQTFLVESYSDMGKHLKVTLLEPLQGRKAWTVYEGHVELVDRSGRKVSGRYEVGDRLPDTVKLNVPWFSQRDNAYHPPGTCNVTCVAMCLYYYGIRSAQARKQLEDELFELVERQGWSRHSHAHLRQVFEAYGIRDVFKTNASWTEVKTHLANGNPVILPGDFTPSGHIIVAKGYDEAGFWVNDPWGEFFHSGYQDKSGENLHYSNSLIFSMCGQTETWAHFPRS